LGTFFYMAPEQADARGQIADTRWDVYALGAILYAMLTGRPQRHDPKLLEEVGRTAEITQQLRIYRDWVRRSPPPVAHRRVRGMDRALAAIIDRCLEIDPGKRWQDAGDVLAALDRRERRRRHRPLLAF